MKTKSLFLKLLLYNIFFYFVWAGFLIIPSVFEYYGIKPSGRVSYILYVYYSIIVTVFFANFFVLKRYKSIILSITLSVALSAFFSFVGPWMVLLYPLVRVELGLYI